jgi:hypothetical protein
MIRSVKRFRPRGISLVGSVVLALVVSTFTNPSRAAEVDSWTVYITESWFAYPSHIGLRTPEPGDPSWGNTFNCPKWGEDECAAIKDPGTTYFGTVILPPCTEPKATYCIETVEFRNPGGEWEQGELIRSTFGPTHEAVAEIGYPYGGTVSLWRSKNVKHAGGTSEYAVQAALEIREKEVSKGGVEFLTVDMRIQPYTSVAGEFSEQRISSTSYVDATTGRKRNTVGFSSSDVWQDRLGRATQARWIEGSGARLTVRIPDSLTGWLGGRLTDIDFSVSRYADGINRLTIGGNAVVVQSVEAKVPSSEIRKILVNPDLEMKNNQFGFAGYRGSDGALSIPILEKIRPFTKDKSTGDMSLWVVQTFGSEGQKCLADTSRLMGVVTTNSVAYDKFAPKFTDGKLKYSVGGVHLDKDGNLVKGNYDLVLRSDAARCLYGFSNAPIEAIVSVTYGDKEQNISTTASGERDGWLFISAKNFTFSNPTIEVAISQPKPSPSATSTPSATASPTTITKPTSKKTITCVKGTAVKKVSGNSPKCPKGFKKRA